MAMNYLWADLYGGGSLMGTAQTTIPEQNDKEAMPQAEHGSDTITAAVRDAGKSTTDTKHILVVMLAVLVLAFLLGAM